MKRYIIIIIVLLYLINPVTAFCLPKLNTGSYVIDEANLISKDTENYIENNSSFLYENRQILYYVVTVNSCEGKKIDEYTELIYDNLNIGSNGMLVLYAKSERTIKVIAGSDISNIITDEIISKYLDDYFVPNMKLGEYNKGIKNGYASFYKLICNYYNIDSSTLKIEKGVDVITSLKTPILVIVTWICTTLCYVTCIFLKIFKSNKKDSITDYLIFASTIIIHILLLFFTYSLEPKALIGIFGLDAIIVYSMFFVTKNNNKKRKQKRRKNKKKKR